MARPKAETADLIDETPKSEAMTYVRIKAFKLETSRGKMKEGMDIDLPADEAAKFIASGDAEAI